MENPRLSKRPQSTIGYLSLELWHLSDPFRMGTFRLRHRNRVVVDVAAAVMHVARDRFSRCEHHGRSVDARDVCRQLGLARGSPAETEP
jgi:hypothetical protein